MKDRNTELRGHARHIILIDDDEVTNFINKELILEVGAADEVLVFEKATDALVFITKENERGARPTNSHKDIILLDINMPGMDGFAFLEQYQKLHLENNVIVVIMLGTQLDEEGQTKMQALKNFVSRFIEKPLTRENIIRIVNDYI